MAAGALIQLGLDRFRVSHGVGETKDLNLGLGHYVDHHEPKRFQQDTAIADLDASTCIRITSDEPQTVDKRGEESIDLSRCLGAKVRHQFGKIILKPLVKTQGALAHAKRARIRASNSSSE